MGIQNINHGTLKNNFKLGERMQLENDLRMEFDDRLETVMNDFIEFSELTYEDEFQNYKKGNVWSWLLEK